MNDESRKSERSTARLRPGWLLTELDQPALAKVADVAAAGALDHIDGEFEEADFPGFVDALDDGAERLVAMLDVRLGARDDRLDRVAKHLFGHVGLPKLKSIAEHGDVVRVLAQLVGVALRFLAKPFEQQATEMFGRQNLGTIGVNFSIAHPDFV